MARGVNVRVQITIEFDITNFSPDFTLEEISKRAGRDGIEKAVRMVQQYGDGGRVIGSPRHIVTHIIEEKE